MKTRVAGVIILDPVTGNAKKYNVDIKTFFDNNGGTTSRNSSIVSTTTAYAGYKASVAPKFFFIISLLF